MDDLFIIAAGGSGAKVVEAMVHLCAAGLCPSQVHVLLVDGDAANGNRQRALQTLKTYQALQAWPWRVKPNTGQAEEIALFATRLEVYSLADQFSTDNAGKLRPLVQTAPQLHKALSVLLDDQELDMDMRVGFTGRPNLGCLVMSRYLQRHLRNHERAKAFVQALEDSARKADSHPCVAVVGSVFGGTGASLLPVARSCIHSVFREPNASGNPRIELYDRMRWGKVMLLPFFRPEGGVNLGIVNPARHYIDTSGALWFYGVNQAPTDATGIEPSYLIGSDSPALRTTTAVAGAVGQNNSAFYHELLTALAILDFYGAPQVGAGQSIRHFSEVTRFNQDGTKAKEVCALSSLPTPQGLRPDLVQSRLALLYHLAAFSLDWRESSSPDFPEYCRGLFQYSKLSNRTGWNDTHHQSLAQERASLKDKDSPCQQLLKYYTRLLLWGGTTLPASLQYTEEAGQYASLHNTLCHIDPKEVQVPLSEEEVRLKGMSSDNLAAKISRLAQGGLIREDASRGGHDHCGHGLDLAPNQLLTPDRTVKLGLWEPSLPASLAYHGFEELDIEKWYAEFRVSMPK